MTPSQDMSTDGLPLTFQLVGNRLDEVLLCQLGHAFEGAVGRQRVPWLPPRVVRVRFHIIRNLETMHD